MMRFSFTSQNLKMLRSLTFGEQKSQKGFNRLIGERKVTVLCAMHVTDVVAPYSLNNNAVRGVD